MDILSKRISNLVEGVNGVDGADVGRGLSANDLLGNGSGRVFPEGDKVDLVKIGAMQLTDGITRVTKALVWGDKLKSASLFLTPKFVVRGTWVGKSRKNARVSQMLISMGAPNYKERQVLKGSGMQINPAGSWGPHKIYR